MGGSQGAGRKRERKRREKEERGEDGGGRRVRAPKKFVLGNGLANLGNTCYMNACLQVLAHAYPFKKAICEY